MVLRRRDVFLKAEIGPLLACPRNVSITLDSGAEALKGRLVNMMLRRLGCHFRDAEERLNRGSGRLAGALSIAICVQGEMPISR